VKFSLLLISFLCGAITHQVFAFGDHDIHVSVSEVTWKAQSSSFEVSVKIFIDDLETALVKEGQGTGLQIGTEKESAKAEDIIAAYLEKHFHITMDGIQLPAEWVGKETTEDFMAIWCYITYPAIKDPKKCTISNDIMFELYDDQRSIMDIRMTSTHKAYTIFEPGKSSWSYTF
jgi:hypothetical protein